MPYIPQQQRDMMKAGNLPNSAGELNYVLTAHIMAFLDGHVSYAALNEVIGVLECCKLELYRKMAAPYEDLKCKENGEVYP